MQRAGDMQLYVHCEECEWTWDDPKNIADTSKGTLGIDIDSEHATMSTIRNEGWIDFALNADDE
jgi:hypothetical protein